MQRTTVVKFLGGQMLYTDFCLHTRSAPLTTVFMDQLAVFTSIVDIQFLNLGGGSCFLKNVCVFSYKSNYIIVVLENREKPYKSPPF